jgi:hypothetical protein
MIKSLEIGSISLMNTVFFKIDLQNDIFLEFYDTNNNVNILGSKVMFVNNIKYLHLLLIML